MMIEEVRAKRTEITERALDQLRALVCIPEAKLAEARQCIRRAAAKGFVQGRAFENPVFAAELRQK